jgi:3-oxoadipate enol-lactonase
MKTITVRGIELAYVDRGQGTPLLLVHGFPLDHSMWNAQIDALADREGCRVIVPDLRGFGQSEAGGDVVTMEDMADDMAALLDGLGIDEPVVFCGLSMGGYVAFQFALKYAGRLAGLILCDTRAVGDTPQVAAARRATAEQVLDQGSANLVAAMMPKLFAEASASESPRLVESLRLVMLENNARGTAAAALGMAQRPDVTASLCKIGCPALVIVGSQDAISTAAEMRSIADGIPGAEFVEIPDCGHMSPMEKPDEVNAAIARFIAGLR